MAAERKFEFWIKSIENGYILCSQSNGAAWTTVAFVSGIDEANDVVSARLTKALTPRASPRKGIKKQRAQDAI